MCGAEDCQEPQKPLKTFTRRVGSDSGLAPQTTETSANPTSLRATAKAGNVAASVDLADRQSQDMPMTSTMITATSPRLARTSDFSVLCFSRTRGL